MEDIQLTDLLITKTIANFLLDSAKIENNFVGDITKSPEIKFEIKNPFDMDKLAFLTEYNVEGYNIKCSRLSQNIVEFKMINDGE